MEINETIIEYIEQISGKEPELLQKLNRETHIKIIRSRMISGHLQGRLLSLLSKIKMPQNILELGTFTGYSALCLAEGLSLNGKLITIEKNKELESFARKYFNLSNYKNNIEMIIGNACEIIPKLNKKFDIVFIDADKSEYTKYFEICHSYINKNGLLIADNVLWDGKVADQQFNDNDTKAIRQFNEILKNHPEYNTTILPIRDGLLIACKK